jgi:hypothetical protein
MPRAYKGPHAEHPAVDHLVRLHADLINQADANQRQAKKLADDMRHVEAVIRIFDPAFDVRHIKGRRRNRANAWFRHGTMFRAVLDVLRAATEPVSAKTIAERMLIAHGHAEPAPKDVRELESGVRSVLKRRLAKDVIADSSKPARWRLIAR